MLNQPEQLLRLAQYIRHLEILRVLDNELWVNLVFLEHNKDGGVVQGVDTAVVEALVGASFLRGAHVAAVSPGELSYQDQSHKHDLLASAALRRDVSVGVCGISGKIAPWKNNNKLCERKKIKKNNNLN